MPAGGWARWQATQAGDWLLESRVGPFVGGQDCPIPLAEEARLKAASKDLNRDTEMVNGLMEEDELTGRWPGQRPEPHMQSTPINKTR